MLPVYIYNTALALNVPAEYYLQIPYEVQETSYTWKCSPRLEDNLNYWQNSYKHI